MIDEQKEQQPSKGLLLGIVQNAGQAREAWKSGQEAIAGCPEHGDPHGMRGAR
jgi:hypothetical protein